MRLLLAAALLMMPACLTECDGVGAIGSMRQGAMNHGAARGDMTPPAGDDAPVGVHWTIPPVFEYAAYLETTAADSDPIETPTCRGSLCSTLALTQGTLASRPLYRALCPVGATTLPCYRVDGGDWVEDATTRAELAFLHDGTGMTCLWLLETSSGGQQGVIHTGDTAGGAPGWSAYYFNGQSYSLWQNATTATTTATGAASTAINSMHALMAIDLVSDTPDMAIFAQDFTTALATASLGTRDTNASNNPLRWGGQWAAGSNVTGYIPLLACWDQRLTTAEREAEQANMEAYFGGTFPL